MARVKQKGMRQGANAPGRGMQAMKQQQASKQRKHKIAVPTKPGEKAVSTLVTRLAKPTRNSTNLTKVAFTEQPPPGYTVSDLSTHFLSC
jgi:hypothetical protein